MPVVDEVELYAVNVNLFGKRTCSTHFTCCGTAGNDRISLLHFGFR